MTKAHETERRAAKATEGAGTERTEAEMCKALGLMDKVCGDCKEIIQNEYQICGCGEGMQEWLCVWAVATEKPADLHTPEGMGRLIAALHDAKHELMIESHSLHTSLGSAYRVALNPVTQESKIVFSPNLERVWIAAGLEALRRGWLRVAEEQSDE